MPAPAQSDIIWENIGFGQKITGSWILTFVWKSYSGIIELLINYTVVQKKLLYTSVYIG